MSQINTFVDSQRVPHLGRMLATLIVLVVVGALWADVVAGAEPSKVAADACVVELALPADAKVLANGQDYGTQRKLVWSGLEPESMTSVLLEVEFAGGSVVQRLVLIEPGRRIRVAFADPGTKRPEVVLQTGHADTILSIAASADGRYVLTGSCDNTAVLWQRDSGKVLRTFRHGTGRVEQVAFGPKGMVLTRGGSDRREVVRVWDMASGSLLHEVRNSLHDVTWASFSPDGEHLLVACADRGLVYEFKSFKYVAGAIPVKGGRVICAEYSPDGTRFVTGGEGVYANRESGTLVLWDAATRARILDFQGPVVGVHAVAFSPSGRLLAVAMSNDFGRKGVSVGLWDTTTGERVRALDGPKEGQVGLAFSPDGEMLLAANQSREAYRWRVADGSPLGKLQAEPPFIYCAAFGGRSDEFLTGHSDQRVRVWDAAAGTQSREFLRRCGAIESLAVSPDGRCVALGLDDGLITVGEPAQGRAASVLHSKLGTTMDVLAFSPDGRRLFAKTMDVGDLFDVHSGHATVRLERPSGETFGAMEIRSAVFSRDGRVLYTGRHRRYNQEGDVVAWDTVTGRQTRSFKKALGEFSAVALSPDGQRLLAGFKAPRGPGDKDVPIAFLFDLASGQQIGEWRSLPPAAATAAFSPDGRRVLTGDWKLRDVRTGEVVSSRQGLNDDIQYFAIGREGRWVVAAGNDTDVVLWDAMTGNQVRRFTGHTACITRVAVSSDDSRLAAASEHGLVIVWDVASGRRLFTLPGHTDMVRSIVFSPDDRQILTGAHDGRAILWDALSGRKLATLANGDKTGITGTAFHDDGRVLVTGGFNGSVVLWDAAGARELRRFSPTGDPLFHLATSPDGNRLAVSTFSRTGTTQPAVTVWDLRAGKSLWRADGDLFDCLLFTPDGQTLVGVNGSRLVLWESATGKQSGLLGLRRFVSNTVAVSADGNRLVTGITDGAAVVIDRNANRIVCQIGTRGGPSALSPDGRLVANVSADHSVTVCEARTGNRMTLLSGHSGPINALAFGADSRTLYTVSGDGTLRLWDVNAAAELAAILEIDGGQQWLAVTPEGLFDGSEDARQTVNFRVGKGLTTVPVDRFFHDFFHPGLLAELLAGARPVPTARFADKVAPRIRIVAPGEGGAVPNQEVEIEVEVSDQGGGIAGPWLMQNGSLVMTSGATRRSGAVMRRTMKIQLVEGENHIEIRAASEDRSWESEPVQLLLKYEKPLARPAVHVVAVGVNRYAEETLNLRFAAPDARAIAELFRTRGPALYGAENVHVTELIDAEATGETIRAAVGRIAKQARAQDLLVLFLAGHGMTVGQRYYFLTHEFRRASSRIEEDVSKQGLASDVLGEMMDGVPALKRAVIYDTCQSGAALPPSRGARDPFVFRAALERLARSHGHFTLAAAPATAQAQEVPQLKHGMLTYALLAGLGAVKDGPLAGQLVACRGDGRVAGIRDWFSYAQDKVPTLTKLYTGQQQFVEFDARGADFPLLPLAGSASSD